MKQLFKILLFVGFLTSCNIQEENKYCWIIHTTFLNVDGTVCKSQQYFYGTELEVDAVIAQANSTCSCYYTVTERYKELASDLSVESCH